MANKHTSGAAIFIFTLEAIVRIAALWFPAWYAAHSAQLTDTINELQKLAVGYGLLMGADSPPKAGEPIPDKSNPVKIVGLVMLGGLAITFLLRN